MKIVDLDSVRPANDDQPELTRHQKGQAIGYFLGAVISLTAKLFVILACFKYLTS